MKKSNKHLEEHIDRRSFLKGVGALGLSAVLPYNASAAELDYDQIQFDQDIYNNNDAQTIIVYLYGGPSELAGNLTNLSQISTESQNPYPLGKMTATTNQCWREAGGETMESLLASEDMNLFRTCYRTVDDLKAHGTCTIQAQKGHSGESSSGIIANLASILHHKGAINEPGEHDDLGKNFPFVTIEGESTFFSEGDLNLPSFLKPAALSSKSVGKNPYERLSWLTKRMINIETNTTLDHLLDSMAQQLNPEGNIKETFQKRELLEQYTAEINATQLPDGVTYPNNNTLAERLELAMKLLIHNPHTKVVNMGSPGVGGWDDHSNALVRYTERMQDLIGALDAAVAHMNAANKTNINIVVYGEFGRNVNYNNSEGWDHGNNQNVYWLGGKDYMNHLGIVGETEVFGTGENNRLYTRPKNFGQEGESYNFQVFSIAATIYKMYGITNPEFLTENNYPINGLLN